MQFGVIALPHTAGEAVEDAKRAEAAGFHWLGVADSQSVFRELYGTAALCAAATSRIRIGPAVTNPITRHPAVTASAVATLDEISGGRAFCGIGTGDSAVLNLGERPVSLTRLREYLQTVRALLRRQDTEYRGKGVHLGWPQRAVPLYLAAEGPRTLELAGEVADGVIIGVGLQPALLREALAHLAAGAARAGRRLADLDLWAFARVNITDDVEAGIDAIRMELASCAHHVFRFTLEGKQVPAELAEAILRVQRGYQPAQHEQAAGANAELMQDPVLLRYLAERFAVVGPAEACVAKLRAVAEAGVPNVLFTGFVRDRAALLRTLGEAVLPPLAPYPPSPFPQY
ncbi:MAG TPA: LLM class flavin-dependent oxidoreductase [Dehalococcoidia bacterium]|nr:LLM class flavin-dependent oxidoreductase [Dehalococcoidia bacterium]